MAVNGRSYAVLGATGNCGTALIENLLNRPDTTVHAYCRSKAKLFSKLPEIWENKHVRVFEGGIHDADLLRSCVRDCQAVFLVVSTNDNLPDCRLGQDTASILVDVLRSLRAEEENRKMPRVLLLSSATLDEGFSRHQPPLLHYILIRSASHVYKDLEEAEKLLRANEDWLTSIFIKPGALSVDVQRGHALSLTDEDGPLSYLDLAAGMIEAADDEEGRYDLKNVSVVNINGRARFPPGTPLCIVMGLLRHYFPFLHPYLPLTTGPR